MIDKLFIKNYLIIKEAEIDFSEGLNILTGETGAGKSIILDALAMILGERADFSLIRQNEDKLIIEGFFNVKNIRGVKEFLNNNDISPEGDLVIIRRELLRKGISRNFINDSPVQISLLKEFGDLIIDIHSQNEHQSILKKETHISLIDSFAGLGDVVNGYKEKYDLLKEKIFSLRDLKGRRTEIIERKKYIEFQLKEINDVNPQPEEYEELEGKLQKMENSEEISTAIINSLNLLYERDGNSISTISTAIKELEKVSGYDSEVLSILEQLKEAYVYIKDASDRLNSISSGLEFDPHEIEQVRDRLRVLSFLKKRFSLSVNEIIELAEKLTQELNLAENFDFEIEKAEKEIDSIRNDVYKSAKNLSALRIKNSSQFEKTVNGFLKEVGLEGAEFKVEFSEQDFSEQDEYTVGRKHRLTSNGIDEVEFLIRTIKGAEFSSLKKSASGGEVSRIMLAIKASLAGKDEVPILVFDEIDTGISGRIAGKVGNLMKQLAAKRQIIAITHLPQIAAMSDKHFSVVKNDNKKDTTAEINLIDGESKIEEIAKMLSGEKITDTSRKTAKELIGGSI